MEKQEAPRAPLIVAEAARESAAAQGPSSGPNSCCCFSLRTGVLILSILDLINACSLILAIAGIFVLQRHEGDIDEAIIESHESPDAPETPDGVVIVDNVEETEEDLEKANTAIEHLFLLVPLFIVLSLLLCVYSWAGIRSTSSQATAATVSAAKRYANWRFTVFLLTCMVSILFCDIFGLVFKGYLCWYFYKVAKAHAAKVEASVGPVYLSAPATAVVNPAAYPGQSTNAVLIVSGTPVNLV